MSAKAIENGEGFAADALLQESQSDEEEEPSQPSSAGSTPGGPPPGPSSGSPTGPDEPGSDSTDQPKGRGRTFSRIAVMAAAAVTGGVLAVGAVPVVLGTMGFTSTGIAASSLAAKMMSAAAIANGGGVPAGSLVATLQSVGRCPEQEEEGKDLARTGFSPEAKSCLLPPSNSLVLSVPCPLSLPCCPLFWLGLGVGPGVQPAVLHSQSTLQNLHRSTPLSGPSLVLGNVRCLPFLTGSALSLVNSPPEFMSPLWAAAPQSRGPRVSGSRGGSRNGMLVPLAS